MNSGYAAYLLLALLCKRFCLCLLVDELSSVNSLAALAHTHVLVLRTRAKTYEKEEMCESAHTLTAARDTMRRNKSAQSTFLKVTPEYYFAKFNGLFAALFEMFVSGSSLSALSINFDSQPMTILSLCSPRMTFTKMWF